MIKKALLCSLALTAITSQAIACPKQTQHPDKRAHISKSLSDNYYISVELIPIPEYQLVSPHPDIGGILTSVGYRNVSIDSDSLVRMIAPCNFFKDSHILKKDGQPLGFSIAPKVDYISVKKIHKGKVISSDLSYVRIPLRTLVSLNDKNEVGLTLDTSSINFVEDEVKSGKRGQDLTITQTPDIRRTAGEYHLSPLHHQYNAVALPDLFKTNAGLAIAVVGLKQVK